MSETGERISRIYNSFRGVDFRGEEINLVRSPDSLNVWKDYKHTESIRTRPGMAHLDFDGKIYGISFYKGNVMVHEGTNLYKYSLNDNTKTMLAFSLKAAPSNTFVYNDIWYFMDGENYKQYDGSKISDVVGYMPTTTIGRRPSGGGTKHEDVNFLSDYRINTFLADGKATDYYLDSKNIDSVVEVKVNDVLIGADKYVCDNSEGMVQFTGADAPAAPKTDGQDNVSIKYKKTVKGYADKIKKCTLLQVFDNRVFASGNPEYPNFVWHCSLDDPTYWSDLDYYREGMDEAKITGLVAGNNALWVFREPSTANTNVFYHTPTIDSEYGKIYPSTHSSITIGCEAKAINFNDDIVFFSSRGMEGISGDVTTEQMAAHRSSLVDRKMTAHSDYKNMVLAEWDGYLLVFIGNKAYLADSRAVFTNENHTEYEWFYWEMEKTVTCAAVYDGVLYLGTTEGIYTLTDNEADIESYWVTPKDKFKAPHKLKTTNKRGCVAEATGDISLYAKTEDTDFELIGEFNGVTDYFVGRIKRKKFKDIQLKFHSKTRFSLETATLECFIGGYIKR
jgi:hypothetical protein